MKIALVCDWLTNVGGAEKVLLALHQMYPEAPIFTSQYNPRKIDWFLDAEVRTGWMQVFPSFLRRFLAPLRAKYFAKLDLSDFDVVISVTGAEAKGVFCGKARHICYCHVPTQYYWQMYDDYVKNPGFGVLNPIVRLFFKIFVGRMRRIDYAAAQKADEFVTISSYAAEQIRKYYGREAKVVAPGVEVAAFRDIKRSKNVDRYIHFSRQVSWKRQDLLVDAFLENGKKITIIGDGPEYKRLVARAKGAQNIRFLPQSDRGVLKKELARAKAFVFPSMEPFGIAPVEALAAGVPVIAFAKGGARDYVKEGVNGLFFEKQDAKILNEAILRFEDMKFDAKEITKSALAYEVEAFKQKMKEIIDAEGKK